MGNGVIGVLLDVAFVAGGLTLLILNRWIAERGIEFQRSIGSFWSGDKSLLMMRFINVLVGAGLVIAGIVDLADPGYF
jgi:hypothetical protein